MCVCAGGGGVRGQRPLCSGRRDSACVCVCVCGGGGGGGKGRQAWHEFNLCSFFNLSSFFNLISFTIFDKA